MSKLSTPSIGREAFADPALERLQTAQSGTLRPIAAFPDAYGKLIVVAFTGAGTLTIAHPLRRAFIGWTVVRAAGAAPTLFEAAAQPDPTRFIALTNGTAGTYTIRIF